MPDITATQPVKALALEAIVFRACKPEHRDRYHAECPDCRLVHDHGTVAYYHKNPLRRWWYRRTGRAT